MLLPVGRIDFYMGGNMIQAFSAVEENIPTLVVARIFQKDPQVLLAHPGQGFDRFEDLKKSNDILISKEGLATFYQWLKTEHGLPRGADQALHLQPGPFVTNKRAVMQGYVTSEPLAVEKAGGFKPVVHLLATTASTPTRPRSRPRREMVEKNPDVVRRFVEASIIGWSTYLYGDNAAGNAAIKKDNPEITDEQLASSLAKMKEYGIVDSGDARTLGIGAMTDARVKSFFDKMVKAGLFKPNLDYAKSYTLQFVNKGVGLDLRPKR
jgi:NitT/TauT family transport system substrate-binding protein